MNLPLVHLSASQANRKNRTAFNIWTVVRSEGPMTRWRNKIAEPMRTICRITPSATMKARALYGSLCFKKGNPCFPKHTLAIQNELGRKRTSEVRTPGL